MKYPCIMTAYSLQSLRLKSKRSADIEYIRRTAGCAFYIASAKVFYIGKTAFVFFAQRLRTAKHKPLFIRRAERDVFGSSYCKSYPFDLIVKEYPEKLI